MAILGQHGSFNGRVGLFGSPRTQQEECCAVSPRLIITLTAVSRSVDMCWMSLLVHGEAHLEHSPRVITGPHLPSEPRRRSERRAGLGRRLPYLWGPKWSSLEAVLFVAVMESSCHLAPCCDGCFRWESGARGCRLLAVNWTFGEKVSEACPSTWCSEPWETVDFLVLPVVDGQLVPRRRHRRVGKKLMEVVWRVCQVLSVGWFVRSSLCLLNISPHFSSHL